VGEIFLFALSDVGMLFTEPTTAADRPEWKSFEEINVYIRNVIILIGDN